LANQKKETRLKKSNISNTKWLLELLLNKVYVKKPKVENPNVVKIFKISGKIQRQTISII
jgi:hypothetical protein